MAFWWLHKSRCTLKYCRRFLQKIILLMSTNDFSRFEVFPSRLSVSKRQHEHREGEMYVQILHKVKVRSVCDWSILGITSLVWDLWITTDIIVFFCFSVIQKQLNQLVLCRRGCYPKKSPKSVDVQVVVRQLPKKKQPLKSVKSWTAACYYSFPINRDDRQNECNTCWRENMQPLKCRSKIESEKTSFLAYKWAAYLNIHSSIICPGEL